jgi:hypothetical protein
MAIRLIVTINAAPGKSAELALCRTQFTVPNCTFELSIFSFRGQLFQRLP